MQSVQAPVPLSRARPNYAALREVHDPLRCAQLSIIYGVRRRVGNESPTAPTRHGVARVRLPGRPRTVAVGDGLVGAASGRVTPNAEYGFLSVDRNSGVAVHRTPHYAQLLRPPLCEVWGLGSWRYGGLPVVIPWPDKARPWRATHAQLPMIDQAQSASKGLGAVFLGDLLSGSRPSRLGCSLWSRRMRSASPCPAPRSPDFGAYSGRRSRPGLVRTYGQPRPRRYLPTGL
jgi:hypothetical protein